MNTNKTYDPGIVTSKTNGHYTVKVNKETYNCLLSTKFSKKSGRRSTDPLAVGDLVHIDENHSITEVQPRVNKLSRLSTASKKQPLEQIIAANLDLVIPVFSVANPSPKRRLLDRYLVAASAADIPVLICITKNDLPENRFTQLISEYREIGYSIQCVSIYDQSSIKALRSILKDRSSVLLGKSGVGKSSLLNALQPGLDQRTGEISSGKQGKGRHTTTRLEMIELNDGGVLIDTPGIREFGLWNIHPDELADHFPEMRPYIGRCKFRLSCTHNEEPGCAIRKAVMDGNISPHRYFSYNLLRAEL